MKKHERQAVFVIFRSSLASEMLFLVIFDEKTQATGCFHRFSLVACKRNAVFDNFRWKNTSDELFFAFSAFRSRATNDFQLFLTFIRGWRAVFFVFRFHPRMKDDFCLFSAFIRGWRVVFPEKSIIYSCILYYFPHIRYILSKYMKFNIKVNNYLSFCYCIHYSLK